MKKLVLLVERFIVQRHPLGVWFDAKMQKTLLETINFEIDATD